jgi:hypothetical protein
VEYGIVVGRELENRGALRVFIPSRDIFVRRVKWLKVVLPPVQVEHLNMHMYEKRRVSADLDIDEELESLSIPEEVCASSLLSIDVKEPKTIGWGASANISVKAALEGSDRVASKAAIVNELMNMLAYKVWEPCELGKAKGRVLYSKMFLKKTGALKRSKLD